MLLAREFVIKGTTIKDEYPALSPDQAKKILADTYPDIINASWTQKMDEKRGILVITFSTNVVGTRG